jgi:hypothetical protein
MNVWRGHFCPRAVEVADQLADFRPAANDTRAEMPAPHIRHKSLVTDCTYLGLVAG